MTKKRLKILDADVQFISLCPRGKNMMSVLYKEDDGSVEFETLLKDDRLEEEGELTALVYAPGLGDADGHFADRDGIKTMCKSFMRNGAKIDIRHDQEALSKDDVFVTECFLTKTNDPEFAGMKDKLGRAVDTNGAWAIRMQIEKEELRKDYRDGKWNGVSLFGPARVEVVSKEEGDSVDRVLDALASRLGAATTPTEEDIDMKKEELVEVMAENNKSLVESLVKALKPESDDEGNDKNKGKGKNTQTLDKEETLEFQGDKTNPDDIKKHHKRLKLHSLQKGVDWNDPESVAKYEEALAKMRDEEDDVDGGEGDDKDDTAELSKEQKEIKRLQKQIDKLEKGSTQGGGNTQLSKEQKECNESADRMAAFVNGDQPND